MPNRARVLMIAWSDLRFYPPVINLGRVLSANNASVRLIGFRARSSEVVPKECPAGFSVERVASYPHGWLGKANCFARMLFRIAHLSLRWRPTLVIAHGSQAISLAIVAQFLSNCRTIYYAHELSDSDCGTLPLRVAKSIEKNVARTFTRVLCANDDRADILQQQLCLLERPAVIPNSPLAAEALCDCKVETALQFARKRDSSASFVITYAGRLGQGMALSELCQAVSEMKHVAVVLAGLIDDEFKEEAKKLFLFPRVHYFGTVEYQHLRRWLAGATAGWVYYEGQNLNTQFAAPCKMYEYLAAGIPVIVNSFPLATSTISKNQLGICIESASLKSISDAIQKICAAKSTRVSCDYQNYFISQLSYESRATQVISAYLPG